MLEIFAKLQSFSFYHKKEAIYISFEVIDCKVTGPLTPAEIFNSVEPGQTLSVKYTGDKTDEYLELLKNSVLIVSTDHYEISKNPKFSDRFIVADLRKCDIFKECL